MPALIWHPDALGDVARLYDFLAPYSPVAAQRAAAVILEAADQIAENPRFDPKRSHVCDTAKLDLSSIICIMLN